jgi:serine/threonine-protein kinase
VVKVADFGLARDLRLQGRSFTETGYTLGTPLYMSPEQVLGRDVDARSDLYSLGMTFYHLLACRPPLTAESPFLLGMKQVNESPADIRAIRPDCPTEIAELLGRLIAKRPEDRPADVSEALEVLNRHDTGRPPAELVAAAEAGAAATARSTIATLPFDTAGYQTGTRTLRLPVGPIVARRFWLRWFGVAAAGFAGAFLFGRLSRRRARRTAGAAAQAWPPSLDLAEWARIERRDTAERQYRFAQIRAEDKDRIAAWLAVPGYFPNDSDWAWRAYVQLAGELVRGGDRLRLMRLKAGLEECSKGIGFANLAEIVQAALDGMDGAEIGMLETLNEHVKDAMDLALAELILTILTHYRQRVGADAIVPTRLTRLQMAVQEVLRIESP